VTGPTEINTGTCEPWTDAEAILGCCSVNLGTDVDLDQAAQLASDLLYEISGHRFPGICETTVRPCASKTSCWADWVPPWHWPYQWFDGPWGLSSFAWHAGRDCSCQPLSKIRLAGYPVREIQEVSIDGIVLDPAEYALRTDRYLIRMADAEGNPQRWPSCQRMDIDEGIGTFFVHYRYGLAPPLAGQLAAAQLACQIAAACPGDDAECEIPAGTVRITRQGLTIDTQQLGLWLIGSMRTGMPLVDAFISTYAGQRRQRRTALAVPELDPWPVRV
jgi:hypothetical protein